MTYLSAVRPLPRLLGLALLGLGVASCEPPRAVRQAAPEDDSAAEDQTLLRKIRDAEANVSADPDSARMARLLARAIEGGFRGGLFDQPRPGVDREALVDEAMKDLDHASQVSPIYAAETLADEGVLLMYDHRPDEALNVLQASLATRPTLDAALPLLTLYDQQHKLREVTPLCRRMRAAIHAGPDRYDLLEGCFEHAHQANIDIALGWASHDDRDYFQGERRRRAAQAAQTFQDADDLAARPPLPSLTTMTAEDRKQDALETCFENCQDGQADCTTSCGDSGGCKDDCKANFRGCEQTCKAQSP